MEFWRRRILLFGTGIGICLAMYTSYAPTVSLRAVDFARKQAAEFGFSDEVAYLKQLPLDQYIEEKLLGRHTVIAGPEETSFFQQAHAASRGEQLSSQWRRRIRGGDRKRSTLPYRVYFRPDEPPLLSFRETLSEREPHYLVLEEDGRRAFLEMVHRTYNTDDLTFGSGLSDPPPVMFRFPLRRIGYGVVGIAVVLYVVLPRRRRPKDAIYFAHWSIIPGDVVSLLLFVPFFVLPMLVSGGAVEAVMLGWFLSLVCWPMALMGAWLLMVMAIYASYEVRVREQGLDVFNGRDHRFYRFSEMHSLQPLRLVPPRWLVTLTSVAALASRGGSRFRLAGQALLLGNSAGDGLSIRMKDKSAAYLWISNQMGSRVLKNAQRLPELMQAKGIELLDKVQVVHALLMPLGERADGKRIQTSRSGVMTGLAVFPLVAMGALLNGWGVTQWIDSTRPFPIAPHVADDGAASSDEGELRGDVAFPAADVVWERRYRSVASPQLQATSESLGTFGIPPGGVPEQYDTYASGIVETPQGGFLIYGAAGPASYADGYLVRTDRSGQKLWDAHVGPSGKGQESLDGALATRNETFLVWGTHQKGLYFDGSEALIALLSESGEILWDKLWGNESQSPRFCTATESDGAYTLYGIATDESNSHCLRLELDRQGIVTSDVRWNLSSEEAAVRLHWVAATRDGGCVVTGEIDRPGKFKDLFVAKLDAEGTTQWRAERGGPKLESGRRVVEMEDGSYVAVGPIDEFSGRKATNVVRFASDGTFLWEQRFQEGSEYDVRDLQSADGELLIAGDLRRREGVAAEPFLLALDAAGSKRWQKRLKHTAADYSCWGAIRSADGAYVLVATRTWGHQQSDAISLIELRAQRAGQSTQAAGLFPF